MNGEWRSSCGRPSLGMGRSPESLEPPALPLQAPSARESDERHLDEPGCGDGLLAENAARRWAGEGSEEGVGVAGQGRLRAGGSRS